MERDRVTVTIPHAMPASWWADFRLRRRTAAKMFWTAVVVLVRPSSVRWVADGELGE